MAKPRMGTGPILSLPDPEGLSSNLGVTETGRMKKAAKEKLKVDLRSWMMNKEFDRFRDKYLDLAIVAKVDKKRMASQDVDNIAKVVLDALGKSKKTDSEEDVYLFYDDSQVARLLVWKKPRDEHEEYDTDTLDISFRIHNPEEQMLLVPVKEM